MAPLSIHAGAVPAALAYVLHRRRRSGRRWPTSFHTAPDAMLTPEGVAVMAHGMKFRRRRVRPAASRAGGAPQVDADRRLFDRLEIQGLPYTYVGKRSVARYNPEALRQLGREAMEVDRPSVPLWGMVAAAAYVIALLAALTAALAARIAASSSRAGARSAALRVNRPARRRSADRVGHD